MHILSEAEIVNRIAPCSYRIIIILFSFLIFNFVAIKSVHPMILTDNTGEEAGSTKTRRGGTPAQRGVRKARQRGRREEETFGGG
jgi:hypothetical protein